MLIKPQFNELATCAWVSVNVVASSFSACQNTWQDEKAERQVEVEIQSQRLLRMNLKCTDPNCVLFFSTLIQTTATVSTLLSK